MRNPGKYCLTDKGNKVIVRNSAQVVNGKLEAELLDDELKPQLDSEGRQKKLLVDPAKCKVIGFID